MIKRLLTGMVAVALFSCGDSATTSNTSADSSKIVSPTPSDSLINGHTNNGNASSGGAPLITDAGAGITDSGTVGGGTKDSVNRVPSNPRKQ